MSEQFKSDTHHTKGKKEEHGVGTKSQEGKEILQIKQTVCMLDVRLVAISTVRMTTLRERTNQKILNTL